MEAALRAGRSTAISPMTKSNVRAQKKPAVVEMPPILRTRILRATQGQHVQDLYVV
jgi:hypothetical protein